MKVVINACYGGFSLSTLAMKRAVAEGAAGVTSMPVEKYTGGKDRGFGSEEFVDVGDGYEVGCIPDVLYKDGNVFSLLGRWGEHPTDPVLVRIVEELGGEAGGRCAELKVIEVPDDVEWEIEEYYGYEHVAEKHRTWC